MKKEPFFFYQEKEVLRVLFRKKSLFLIFFFSKVRCQKKIFYRLLTKMQKWESAKNPLHWKICLMRWISSKIAFVKLYTGPDAWEQKTFLRYGMMIDWCKNYRICYVNMYCVFFWKKEIFSCSQHFFFLESRLFRSKMKIENQMLNVYSVSCKRILHYFGSKGPDIAGI